MAVQRFMLILAMSNNSLINKGNDLAPCSPHTHFRQKRGLTVRIMGIALAEYKPDSMQTN
jgi:hypothetical protein